MSGKDEDFCNSQGCKSEHYHPDFCRRSYRFTSNKAAGRDLSLLGGFSLFFPCVFALNNQFLTGGVAPLAARRRP